MDTSKENEKIVVLGVYSSVASAEAGLDAFRSEGFRASDISALLPEGDTTKQFGHTKASKAPEAAATGGAAGIVLGGTLGWLAGIGSVIIPGLGALIAAGPIMAALTGVGIGGTLGALTGALVGMGIPEYEAKRYEGQVKSGGTLVSVHCDNSEWEELAKKVFKRTNATDISSTTEASSGTSTTSRDRGATANM